MFAGGFLDTIYCIFLDTIYWNFPIAAIMNSWIMISISEVKIFKKWHVLHIIPSIILMLVTILHFWGTLKILYIFFSKFTAPPSKVVLT